MRDTGIKTVIGMGIFIALFWFIIIVSIIPAWITHIIWVVSNLNADNAITISIFGIFATMIFFVGAVHGWSIWLGYEWMTPIYTKSMTYLHEVVNIGIGT